MPTVVRIGLFVLCLFGIVVGASAFFGGELLLAMCGKSCSLNRALTAVFGTEFTKVLLAALWFCGAAVAGWLAVRQR
jgi:hypothetical protein